MREQRTATFDFDHTLKFETGEPNMDGIHLFQDCQRDMIVHVVTTRHESKAGRREIQALLDEHGLVPESVIFTNGLDKLGFLRELGSTPHHEDDEEEISQIENAGSRTVNLFNKAKWDEHMESL
jgi:hypothetical protein